MPGTLPSDQPGFAPENFTTLTHFSVSPAMSLPNSAGVIGIGKPPKVRKLCLHPGIGKSGINLIVQLADDFQARDGTKQ